MDFDNLFFLGGIALIVLAVGWQKATIARAKSGELDRERFAEFEDRIGAMEKRLSDIQEVVLSIDEKLEKEGRL